MRAKVTVMAGLVALIGSFARGGDYFDQLMKEGVEERREAAEELRETMERISLEREMRAVRDRQEAMERRLGEIEAE